jgi:hypothetical protein
MHEDGGMHAPFGPRSGVIWSPGLAGLHDGAGGSKCITAAP